MEPRVKIVDEDRQQDGICLKCFSLVPYSLKEFCSPRSAGSMIAPHKMIPVFVSVITVDAMRWTVTVVLLRALSRG
jgi:hypothetical protein